MGNWLDAFTTPENDNKLDTTENLIGR